MMEAEKKTIGRKPGSTGVNKAVREFMADGEWHPMTEIYRELHHLVPVHSALRAAIRYKKEREDKPTIPKQESRTILIARGIAIVLASSLRAQKAERRGKKAMEREWRMPLPEEVQRE